MAAISGTAIAAITLVSAKSRKDIGIFSADKKSPLSPQKFQNFWLLPYTSQRVAASSLISTLPG